MMMQTISQLIFHHQIQENLRTFHEGNKLQDLLKAIMTERKNLKSNVPITVKVSPDINEDQVNQITEILLDHEIKAIIVSNTSEATRDKLRQYSKTSKRGLVWKTN
jgi:dihydroorotate dehydrogenase